MAADWEKLSDDWAGNEIGLIAEVDCTNEEAEDICAENSVEGFPTIKYGDPTALMDYDGARDYESLAAFAKDNLKPVCSPKNIDNCDDEKKATIAKLSAMSDNEIDGAIDSAEANIHAAEEKMNAEIEKLQQSYEDLISVHDLLMDEMKSTSHLGLLKAVRAFKKDGNGTGKDEL